MFLDGNPEGRVLRGVRHGGHNIQPTNEAEAETARKRQGDRGTFTLPEIVEPISPADFLARTTRFRYALDDLSRQWPDHHLPDDDPAVTVAALQALGHAMVDASSLPDAENPFLTAPPNQVPATLRQQVAPIAPVYTYWGQFVDHDLTMNTDRTVGASDVTGPGVQPIPPVTVVQEIGNARHPALNLDSLYGDGPSFHEGHRTVASDQYRGIKFRLGRVATRSTGPNPIAGVRIPPEEDLDRDLPRSGREAVIADGRNDENLIVAQLHLAFLRFHNAAVDWVRRYEQDRFHGDEQVFGRARQLTRWAYQWVTLHDFLPRVARADVVEAVLERGDPRFAPRDGEVWMPLEFSVAAFRFGHSMIRDSYDFNRNFGAPGLSVLPGAPFGLLFAFTGGGRLGGRATFDDSDGVLPFNWVVEWDRMADSGTSDLRRLARTIDTRIAPPMASLDKEIGPDDDPTVPPATILRHLAVRNLLRGYLLSLPTGQAAAQALGVAPLTEDQLRRHNTPKINEALDASDLLARTPLWYYVLKEAEVQTGGRTLGELGSRIVCETIVGQVRHDPHSYLGSESEWTPEDGVRTPDGRPVATVQQFLRFAGVLA